MPYIDSDELKAYLNVTVATYDDELDAAVDAASKWVEWYCRRSFAVEDTATARTFRSYDGVVAYVDDISTTDDLEVAVDQDGDGIYEDTWTIDTDFLAEVNGDGVIDQLVAVGSKTFRRYRNELGAPLSFRRPSVQVTALWGWAETPSAVKQASKIVAAELFKLKDAPFGVVGVGDFGPLRIGAGTIGRAQSLLDQYANPPVLA